jgi:hypothetical protein
MLGLMPRNSAGTGYGNEVSFSTLPAAFYIGQSYGGGIIFYIDGSGNHGLIVSASNLGNAKWGCEGTSIPGTSTAIGTGQANTTTIANGCSTAGIAARICNDLVLNGYDDWFLPSKDELNQLYLQEPVIGFLPYGNYWSSSEYNADNAWHQNLRFGNQFEDYKSLFYNVRAIRAF